MRTIVPHIIDILVLSVPAVSILRYGWPAIPVGVLVAWFLPLLTTRIVGPSKESVESDYYWRLIGWMFGLGYALFLWVVRLAFRAWRLHRIRRGELLR